MADTQNLVDRHRSESKFHDKKAEKKVNKQSFYTQGAIRETHNKMLRIAGNLEDKKVLDFGCGVGLSTVDYARKGARVTGLDISMGAIKKAKQLTEDQNLQNRACFVRGSCEFLPFREEFDIIIGVAILHHLDLNLVVKSLKNTLNKGGRAIFMEPLDHNPLINLFRILTPGRRTKDEKPIEIDFIKSLNSDFSEVNIYGYDLLTLLSYVFIPLKAFNLFRTCHQFLSRLDKRIFKTFPKLQKYCWGAIIEIRK